MNAVVLGSNGYGGMLLLRLLAYHPAVERVIPAARSQAGMEIGDADPGLPHHLIASGKVQARVESPEEALSGTCDVVFSALPHGASAEVCGPILGRIPVIDLSADFRFSSEERFSGAYGSPRPEPDHQEGAVYGLVEWYRHALADAKIIANPGCYPTATLMPLLPLYEAGIPVSGPIVVNALSGITGAGRSPKVNTLYGERTENANAYNPGTLHRHYAEITEQLDLATARAGDRSRREAVYFNPHLVPMKQGMAVTTVVPTPDTAGAIAALTSRYRDEPFVELTGTRPPETREVRGTNLVRIGWREEKDAVILMSVLDNLWKGASGQAIQNMNVLFGLDETTGLLGFGDL